MDDIQDALERAADESVERAREWRRRRRGGGRKPKPPAPAQAEKAKALEPA
jgi:hypothetical protein